MSKRSKRRQAADSVADAQQSSSAGSHAAASLKALNAALTNDAIFVELKFIKRLFKKLENVANISDAKILIEWIEDVKEKKRSKVIVKR